MLEDVRRMVGDNVRRLRLAAGLSQAEVADGMGVDRGYVSGPVSRAQRRKVD
jgi:DNA-binding transcriptional regulator LsrR (DeoR family)